MRQKRPEYTLVAICALFGVSRQAYYLAHHKDAKKSIAVIIGHYNDRRPHASLNYHTPDQAHGMSGEIKKRWKGCPRPKKGKEENQVTGIDTVLAKRKKEAKKKNALGYGKLKEFPTS